MNKPGCLSILARPGSQAGCSFVKALYCISFLCQSPFPVAVPCQTMTLCFLQVAWRRVCHEPRGLTASHWTTSKTPLRLSVCFQVITHLALFTFSEPRLLFQLNLYLPLTLLLLFYIPSSPFHLLKYFLICYLTSVLAPLLLHVSLRPHLLSSLHPFFPPPFVPLSRSEEGLSGVFLYKPQVQTTPCEGISPTRRRACSCPHTDINGATVHTENIRLFLAISCDSVETLSVG